MDISQRGYTNYVINSICMNDCCLRDQSNGKKNS